MENLNTVEEIHLADYWNVIKKRRNLIFAFLISVVMLTMVISLLMKPVYQATARLTIDRESSSSPLTGQRTEFIDVQSQLLTFNTHFKLIKSKPVIEGLIKALEDETGETLEHQSPPTNPLSAAVFFLREAKDRLTSNIKLLIKREEAGLSES